MKIFRIKLDELGVIEKLVTAKRKVDAMKHLRAITGAGIREAKDAIDQLSGRALKNPLAVVQSNWVVDSVKVISPTGKRLELSIKELELSFLKDSTNISLDEVADLLDLTNYIKNWQSRGLAKDD